MCLCPIKLTGEQVPVGQYWTILKDMLDVQMISLLKPTTILNVLMGYETKTKCQPKVISSQVDMKFQYPIFVCGDRDYFQECYGG